MKINHRPIFDTSIVEKHYTEKDGVPVKYVCTSAINLSSILSVDVFYRETPHPEFGNHYFGLYYNMTDTSATQKPQIMITNADSIENVEFGMIEGPNGWEYSQNRWDYYQVGNTAIDGGRAYVKLAGDLSVPVKTMKVADGNFVEVPQ
jgi:hypothetical protein